MTFCALSCILTFVTCQSTSLFLLFFFLLTNVSSCGFSQHALGWEWIRYTTSRASYSKVGAVFQNMATSLVLNVSLRAAKFGLHSGRPPLVCLKRDFTHASGACKKLLKLSHPRKIKIRLSLFFSLKITTEQHMSTGVSVYRYLPTSNFSSGLDQLGFLVNWVILWIVWKTILVTIKQELMIPTNSDGILMVLYL